jgi:hypothetical protein
VGTRFSKRSDPIPSMLYRYLSWQNPNHKKLLTDNEVYLAQASSFNDPFDCQLEIKWNNDPQVLRENLEPLARRDFPELSPEEIRNLINKQVAEVLDAGFEEKKRRRLTQIMDQGFGILCLTETRSSPLMWAHYANSHRGICVGFDRDGLEEVGTHIHDSRGFGSHIYKVQYCHELPVFDTADPPPQGEMVRRAVRTKSSDWSYEREYRFVVGLKDNTRTWRYSNDALAEVILGCRIDPTDEQRIREILQKKDLRPALFRAVIRRGQYALDFRRIEY